MARIISFQLGEQQQRRLNELAATVRRSEQDFCREALEEYLHRHEGSGHSDSPDRYASLRKMIGLVERGPTDASIAHDHRPGDEP